MHSRSSVIQIVILRSILKLLEWSDKAQSRLLMVERPEEDDAGLTARCDIEMMERSTYKPQRCDITSYTDI